jgi:hypothetical protein
MHKNTASNWKDVKSYTLGARLLAISAVVSGIVSFSFLAFFASNITEVFAGDNPLGPITAMIFIVPFVALTLLNVCLLMGVLHKNITAFIIAACVLPIEWITGLVLGGNAISSGLFNGKQYLSAFSHHHELQILTFAVLANLSFYVYGREYRDARRSKNHKLFSN